MNAPQVPVTGNVGAGGVFPILNAGAVNFSADSNHTMVYPEMSGVVINMTSSVTLTAAHAMIAPLALGFWFIVYNNTTGGQNINVAGVTGAAASVAPDGLPHLVVCDGANYALNQSAPTAGITAISIASANGLQGSSSGGSTPTLTIGVDGLHVLPVNTGSASLFLNEAGNYTSPAGSLGGTLSSGNLAFGPGSGTGPTLTSIVGQDGNHRIQITPGPGSTAGSTLFTVTFTASRGHNTYPIVTQFGQTAFNQLCVPLVITSSTEYIITTGQAGVTSGVPLTFNVSCP
jgi:hypothetical protein